MISYKKMWGSNVTHIAWSPDILSCSHPISFLSTLFTPGLLFLLFKHSKTSLPLSFCSCYSFYQEQIFAQILAWLTFSFHSYLHLTVASAEIPPTVPKITPLVTFFHVALLFFKALISIWKHFALMCLLVLSCLQESFTQADFVHCHVLKTWEIYVPLKMSVFLIIFIFFILLYSHENAISN